jgi:GntR family transcriptional regulator, transcriptional repressor for pyruvate dehydrogenase complex
MRFQPIKPKKISTQVSDQLRESILSGDFAPGDKLPPERELAEMFQVSRPSVREAMNILASAGLVMSYQGGGTVVLSLVDNTQGNSLGELIRNQQGRALEVIEVRKDMESCTAYYAAQRALPKDIQRMEEILECMELNLRGQHTSEDLDANLHIIIARSTHNIVWLHLMQSLFDAMREFQRSVWRAVYLTSEDHHLLFKHHSAIVASIRNKDANASRAAMMDHLNFAEQRCIDFVGRATMPDCCSKPLPHGGHICSIAPADATPTLQPAAQKNTINPHSEKVGELIII